MQNRHQDFSENVRKHTSPLVRALLLLAGTVCVLAGVAGIFLPVLPTTPFLLVAAACYARASCRLYNALLNNRSFGPTILEWQEHRTIRFRTKVTAVILMALTLSTSIVFYVEPFWLQLSLAAFGVFLAIYICRIPSRPGSAVSGSDKQFQ